MMNEMLKGLKYIIIILIIIFPQAIAFPKESHNDANIKIVVIGLDGLEWSIIKELEKEGKMPTFVKLTQGGSYGNLKIFRKGYSSPTLWTSLATGKRPDVHGILDFTIREDNKYELFPIRSDHRKVKALWNILSENGEKVGVINYFATWPPEEINGFIISDRKRRRLEGADLYPRNLLDEINSIFKSHEYNGNGDSLERSVWYLNAKLDKFSATSLYLYQRFNKDLDLLVTYTHSTDVAQHLFWKFMEPEFFQHPAWELNSENIEKYGSLIKDMYLKIEGMIKEMMKHIDEDTIVIVCSDHGFQRVDAIPVTCLDNLDNLLEALGFLAFRNNIESQGIDFSKTKAYHYLIEPRGFPVKIIRINLKGREPEGIVESGETFFRVKSNLIGILSNLKVVETGEKLFNEVSEGSFGDADIKISAKNNIDLLRQHIKINEKFYPLNTFYTPDDFSGRHRNHAGVLIIYGKNIEKAKLIEDAHILDIAPTILCLLGLPIARDMEGKVLIQSINANFLKRNPVRYIDTYEVIQEKDHKEFISHPIDEEEIERLKSLGYIQ